MVFEVRESIYDGFRVTGYVLYHLLGLDIASDVDQPVAAVYEASSPKNPRKYLHTPYISRN